MGLAAKGGGGVSALPNSSSSPHRIVVVAEAKEEEEGGGGVNHDGGDDDRWLRFESGLFLGWLGNFFLLLEVTSHAHTHRRIIMSEVEVAPAGGRYLFYGIFWQCQRFFSNSGVQWQ